MENQRGEAPVKNQRDKIPMENQRGEAPVESQGGKTPMAMKHFLIAGIIVALLIGVAAVFLASGDPDGLESTALVVQGQKTLTGGTPEDAVIHEDMPGKFSYSPPMQDYSLGEKPGPWGGIPAIMAGTLLAFLAVLGSMKLMKISRRPKEEQPRQ